MTKETRIGLLVGMGMIIFVCILVSDMMSADEPDAPADLSGDGAADAANPRNNEPIGQLAELQRPGPDTDDAQGSDRPRRLGGHSLSQTGEFQPSIFLNSPDAHRAEQARDAARDGFTFHHVQPGESPWSIAEKHYGDGNYYQLIYEHNRDKMPSADTVRKGVTLRIPKRNDVASPPPHREPTSTAERRDPAPSEPAPSAESAPDTVRTVEHTVAEGETMLEIAQRYYGTVRALPKLMALNEDRIEDPDRVRVGQKIRVPAEPRR